MSLRTIRGEAHLWDRSNSPRINSRSPFAVLGGLLGLCCLGVGLIEPASAQINNFGSPYARFGMGEFQPLSGASLQSIGGMQAAIAHPQWINTENPASLALGALTRVEMGAQARLSNLQTNQQTLVKSNINLAHLALAIPLGKSLGTALSFAPMSLHNYDVLGSGLVNPGGGQIPYKVDEYYTGRGGINRLSWGIGWQIHPKWRVGYGLNAMFGQTIKEFRRVFPDSVQAFNVRVQDQWSVLGACHQLGFQFQPRPKAQRWSGILGMSIRLPANLPLRQNLLAERFTLIAGNLRIRDTVVNVSGQEGDMHLPMQVVVGYWVENAGKSGFGLEGIYEPLSSWRVMGVLDSMQDRWTIKAGGYLVGKPSGNRVTDQFIYRSGLRFSPGGLRLRDRPIHEMAIYAGVGVPLRRSASLLNLGLEFGRWGRLDQGLVQENFMRVSLTLNLNDRWFIRRVYD